MSEFVVHHLPTGSNLEQELAGLVLSGKENPDTLEIKAGKNLFKQGDFAGVMYLVLEGTFDVLIDDEIVGDVGPGAIFGELALLADKRRTATIRARTDARVASVKSDSVDWDALKELAATHGFAVPNS